MSAPVTLNLTEAELLQLFIAVCDSGILARDRGDLLRSVKLISLHTRLTDSYLDWLSKSKRRRAAVLTPAKGRVAA